MRKFLLYSSALVVLGLSSVAETACIQTPSCSSLGYSSSSSCSGGVKCPFGNYWNCTGPNNTNKITELTNKITTLETKVNELSKDAATANCKIGDILYSDMSCNANVVASKTPIGVIFDTTNTLAVSLSESERVKWSTTSFDIPNLNKPTNINTDFNGKKNTQLIIDYCQKNNKSCPAVEYASNYKTDGTKVGDWYLPATGELLLLLANRKTVNTGLNKVGGDVVFYTEDGSQFRYYHNHWASSIYNADNSYLCSSGSCREEKKTEDYESYSSSGDNYTFSYTSRPIINYTNFSGS